MPLTLMTRSKTQRPERAHPLILLVDDQPRNLQLLGNSLLKLDYDILFAGSGEEALTLVKETHPDLILLDIMMPGVDGYEVCRMVHDDYADEAPPVIFVTARSEAEDIAEGLDVGAVDYITKPIRIAEVKARVRTHLDLARSKQRLREINQRLEKINREQRFLLSVLSHDLRSPLSGVELYLADLLEDLRGAIPEDAKDGLETILGSVSAMSSLLEELLQWARYQNSRDSVTMDRFDLLAMVEETVRLLQAKVTSKQLNIRLEIPPDLSAVCDLRVFGTVIRNLLSNAVKFSQRGGAICIRAAVRPDNTRVRVEVEDEGVGMREDQIAVLFDPANRESTLGTEREHGSGLGMILCQSLLELMDSRLEVRSEIDKGTCFWFDLPKDA